MSTLLTPPQPLTPEPWAALASYEPSGMLTPEAEAVDPRSRVRCWVAGAALAATMAGTLTLGAVQPAIAVPLESGTISPQLRDVQSSVTAQLRYEAPSPSTSTAEGVARLRADSGLTWDQLGRLFGVSRRAVHLWAAGKHMNARNIELLSALQRVVARAPGNSAQERRAWLFAADQEDVVPLEQFMLAHRRVDQSATSGTGYTPAGLLGMELGER